MFADAARRAALSMDSLRSADSLVLRVKVLISASIIGSIGLLVTSAAAEESPVPSSAMVADGIDGLPGLYRLPLLAQPGRRVGAGVWLNYGYTEPQTDADGPHHRIAATGSIGGAWWRYLELALRYDLRHDVHPGEEDGADSGTVIDFTPLVRAGIPLGPFSLGAEGRFLFSGAGQQSVPGPTPEGRLIINYAKAGFWVSGFAGYRAPFFGHDDIEADRLRSGDRVALGVSEFSTLTTGLGVMRDFSQLSVLGEFSWDMALGQGAPPVGQSPLRIGIGARRTLLRGLNLQAMVEVSPGGRAPSATSDPLVPIEPRVAATLGLSVRLPNLVEKPKTKVVEAKPAPRVEPPPAAEPPPPPPPKARVLVEIVDENGHPISDARVTVGRPDATGALTTVYDVPLVEVNRYAAIDLEPGVVELTIEADLLQSYTQEVTLVGDEEKVVSVTLRKAVAKDGQLRGLVRSFSGQGVAAKVQVEPGQLEVFCDEQGAFELDLPPGTYNVIIEAEGYLAQKRPVRIRKDGVTVLNADLQRSH